METIFQSSFEKFEEMQLVYGFLYFENRLFLKMYNLLCFHTQNPFFPPFPLWPKVILASTASVAHLENLSHRQT